MVTLPYSYCCVLELWTLCTHQSDWSGATQTECEQTWCTGNCVTVDTDSLHESSGLTSEMPITFSCSSRHVGSWCIILYYIILYYIILYYIILYYIILYYIMLYYIILYYIILRIIEWPEISMSSKALLRRPQMKYDLWQAFHTEHLVCVLYVYGTAKYCVKWFAFPHFAHSCIWQKFIKKFPWRSDIFHILSIMLVYPM